MPLQYPSPFHSLLSNAGSKSDLTNPTTSISKSNRTTWQHPSKSCQIPARGEKRTKFTTVLPLLVLGASAIAVPSEGGEVDAAVAGNLNNSDIVCIRGTLSDCINHPKTGTKATCLCNLAGTCVSYDCTLKGRQHIKVCVFPHPSLL